MSTQLRAAIRRQQSVTLLSLIALLVVSGCTSSRVTIKKWWEQVPTSVRWTAKPNDRSNSSETPDEAEPVVAANVASTTDVTEEADAVETAAAEKSNRSRFSWLDPWSNSTDQAAAEAAEEPSANEASSLPAKVERHNPNSAFGRLSAALTDDSLTSQVSPFRHMANMNDRIRVDTLLARARRLLDIGELEQARETAQAALELGEESRVEFSPDEERPADLVRLIDHELNQTGNDSPTDSISRKEGKDSEPSDEHESAVSSAEPIASPGKEAGSKSFIKRDWSNLFRREKKPSDSEADAVARHSRTKERSASVAGQASSRRVVQTSSGKGADAVVVANRSVSLGLNNSPPELAIEALEDDSDLDEIESNRTTSVSTSKRAAALRDRDDLNESTESRQHRRQVESDDSNTPPEMDMSDLTDPFEEPSISSRPSLRAEVSNGPNLAVEFNWIYVYIGFGICSLLAWQCYRRGAT